MSASNFTPHGLKILLECLSRAALLAQPHDIPGFLCAQVKNMITSSDEESSDIKEVVLRYQRQWERTFFENKRNWTETPRPSPEEFPTPASNESSAPSVSAVPTPPSEDSESSLRTTSQCERVRPAAEKEKLHSSDSSRTQSLSERIPSQMETELYLQPPWPVLPPIRQKLSKQDQRQKAAQECVCCLADCPYHNKDTESSPADQSLGPVSTSTGPAAKKDPRLQKSKAEPGPFEIHFPYRPKGGYIIDPELEPKKASAGPLTNRMTVVESALLFGRQGTACGMRGSMLEGINLSQVSVETTPYTCSYSKPNAHIFRYKDLHVQCSPVHPK